MKRAFSVFLALVILCVFAGCGTANLSDKETTQTELTEPSESSTDIAESETEESAESSADNNESVTPYQFLNLMCGNADEITFKYTVRLHETDETESGSFYKSGESSVAIFTTKDSSGKAITVRELLKDGRVYYIMDVSKTVKSYLSPAEDFLIYEMMKTTNSSPDRTSSENGYTVYEYSVPFEQDESIEFLYNFYMQNGTLAKMTYSVDGMLTKTYEFSAFTQETADKTLFDCPVGYIEETYDYAFSGEHMPPWWENDGLSDF